jgi:hypothetical protein
VLLSTLPCPVVARVFPTTSFTFLRWRVVLPSLKVIRRGKTIFSICIARWHRSKASERNK